MTFLQNNKVLRYEFFLEKNWNVMIWLKLTSGISKSLRSRAAVRATCNFGNKLQSAKVILFESIKSREFVSSSNFVFKNASNLARLWINRCSNAWKSILGKFRDFFLNKEMRWFVNWLTIMICMVCWTFYPSRKFRKNVISGQLRFWMLRRQTWITKKLETWDRWETNKKNCSKIDLRGWTQSGLQKFFNFGNICQYFAIKKNERRVCARSNISKLFWFTRKKSCIIFR